MCPGVGKTYAMLQAARGKIAEGVEVVVGVVETHAGEVVRWGDERVGVESLPFNNPC